MPYVALNNAASTLSGGLTSIATAISVQVGHGAKFAVGANYSYLTLQDASSNIEIVKLTSVTGDVLNVVRAQDGTAARVWGIGDTIGCRPCAAGFNDFAVGPQITNSTSKVTPVDADELGVTDSAATFGLKKLTWANLKATLVTYFNTLFTKVDGSNATGTWSINTSGNAATATNATNAPTSANNLVRAVDLQAQTVTAFTTGGTGTAFTLTPAPDITAYAANQEWDVSFSAACGAAPTFQVSGVATPPNLVKQNADGTYSNLIAGAFPSGWQSKVKMVSTTQALVRSLPSIKPSFSVHKNGTDQLAIASATFTKLTWPTEEWDTNNNFASDRFTPTVAGKYQLSVAARFSVPTDQMDMILLIYKNGSVYKDARASTSGTGVAGLNLSIVVSANGTTDYFETYIYQASGSNKDVSGIADATFFQGAKVD